MIASGGKDRTIRKWNLQGKLLSSWQAHGRGGVTTLAWSPAGDILASGGSDRLITLWDAESNTQVGGFSAHNDEIRKLRWSPDGKLLSSCAGKKDHLVHLWDPYTHQKIATLDGHEQEVVGTFWSADSRWILTVSADRTLRCWDLNSSPAVPAGPPMPLDEGPLTMEGAASTNCIAIGTSGMYILVLQLTN
jgi:WD40 repeat protein